MCGFPRVTMGEVVFWAVKHINKRMSNEPAERTGTLAPAAPHTRYTIIRRDWYPGLLSCQPIHTPAPIFTLEIQAFGVPDNVPLLFSLLIVPMSLWQCYVTSQLKANLQPTHFRRPFWFSLPSHYCDIIATLIRIIEKRGNRPGHWGHLTGTAQTTGQLAGQLTTHGTNKGSSGHPHVSWSRKTSITRSGH